MSQSPSKTVINQSIDKSILGQFAHSKVASNVLMLLMFLAGFWGLKNLNVQFFPSFELEIINISIPWNGANPEDVERSIIKPVEEAVRGIDNIDKITSTAALGIGAITITFSENADMSKALEDVKQKVAEIRNLPAESDPPSILRAVRYEAVGSLVLSAANLDIFELHKIARQIEAELTKLGIHKIDIDGAPQMEISIQINTQNLLNYGLTLSEVNQQVKRYSLDAPVGSVAENNAVRDLRIVQQGRNELDYRNVPISLSNGQYISLGDIAEVSLTQKENSPQIRQNGHPAITLKLSRLETDSTLKTADIIRQWEQQLMPNYTDRVDISIFNKRWVYLEQRIGILIKNGFGGLVLVVLMLMIFMNLRVAFWVAMGIPASLMLTMLVFYYIGGSINMISLFAFIMVLGIIVDDAIVVGEHTVFQHEQGKAPLQAAIIGAKRMFFPVVASSLTTVAAFLPLMLLSGTIGKFLIAIPMVVICVIIASLFESLFVLPGHLNHALDKLNQKKPSTHSFFYRFRQGFDAKFKTFQEQQFRYFVEKCLQNRLLVITFTLVCFWIGITMLQTGKVRFVFFPAVESGSLYLRASFLAGTPQESIKQYIQQANKALKITEKEFGNNLIIANTEQIGFAVSRRGSRVDPTAGSIFVELTEPDQRRVSNREFIRRWRAKIPQNPAIEKLEIAAFQSGPGGKDVSFQLFGNDIDQLKAAALSLADKLSQLPGVSNAGDDLAYGKEQLILRLTPLAKSLNLSLEDISRQVRTALNGALVQTFNLDKDDIDVRLRIPQSERNSLASLNSLQIRLPDNSFAPLPNLVNWEAKKSYANIRHYNTLASVNVFADLNAQVATLGEILSNVETNVLPQISSQYNVSWEVEGTAKRQGKTFNDMITGLMIGLMLIYVILVWVFGSWGWPFVVIAIIPFGLFGAIIGHWLLDLKLNILSLFGMFGLSGIVINDSIVLVTTYRQLRTQGIAYQQALVDASCQRLRAVLLTSLTTIVGLVPLLFETSLQAQFLIPMATTISFGLFFATLLILILVPTLLSLYESVMHWRETHKANTQAT